MESTRERSPNYPTSSLETAVALIARVYEAEKRASIPLVIVAQAFSENEKVTKLSGPMRSKIACLRAYGLIEDTSPGKVRVSDRALAILQQPTPAMFHNALREAALAPPLFAELYTEHRDDSETALKYHLMTERRFTEDGANRAIRSYRDTMAYADVSLQSYASSSVPGKVEPPDEEKRQRTKGMFDFSNLRQFGEREDNADSEVSGMAYTWPLPGGTDAELRLLGNKPSVAAYDRLIAQITFMRDDLEAEKERGERDPAADA